MKTMYVMFALFLVASSSASEETGTFTFGVIADCQYCDGDMNGVRHYRDSPEKLRACVEQLNTIDLEFSVHLGDFIDRDWESFDVVLPILAQLKKPSYHVLGNHDYAVEDDKKPLVHSKLSMPSRYYDFSVHGWRFVALDGNDISLHGHPSGSEEQRAAEKYYTDNKIESPKWNGALGRAQMKWLQGVLDDATEKGESVVLMAHFPVYPKNAHNLWNADEIIKMIEANSCVKAYINGHNHAGNYGEKKGVHYITFKGMVDSTENSFANIMVSPNELSIKGFGREDSRKLTLRKD